MEPSRGRAKALTSADGETMPELPAGFSRYLAPEVRRGTVVSSPSMDIYAAGMLMLGCSTSWNIPRSAGSPRSRCCSRKARIPGLYL